jgi:hypothetical protein
MCAGNDSTWAGSEGGIVDLEDWETVTGYDVEGYAYYYDVPVDSYAYIGVSWFTGYSSGPGSGLAILPIQPPNRKLLETLLSSCPPSGSAPPPAFYANLGNSAGWVQNDINLYQFHRGGSLDAQVRYGGSQAYANYAFGVYMASAGYSLSATLTAANTYAAGFSTYPPQTAMNPNYNHIPASNVTNITQGFNDAQNGTLCNPY